MIRFEQAAIFGVFALYACRQPSSNDSSDSPLDSEDTISDTEETGLENQTLQWDYVSFDFRFGYDPITGVFDAIIDGTPTPAYLDINILNDEGVDELTTPGSTTEDVSDENRCYIRLEPSDAVAASWDQTDVVDGIEESVHHSGFQFTDYTYQAEQDCQLAIEEQQIPVDDLLVKSLFIDLGGNVADNDLPIISSVGLGQLRSDVYEVLEGTVSDTLLAKLVGAGISVNTSEGWTEEMYTGTRSAQGVVVGDDGIVPTGLFSSSDELLDDQGQPVRGYYEIKLLIHYSFSES